MCLGSLCGNKKKPQVVDEEYPTLADPNKFWKYSEQESAVDLKIEATQLNSQMASRKLERRPTLGKIIIMTVL